MKKIYYCSLIGTLCFIGLSCQEDPLTNKKVEKPIESMEQQEKVAYAKRNLLTLGNAVISLAKNDLDFRKTLYTEIEKTFDGDYNVLLKKLSGEDATGRTDSRLYGSLITVTGSAENAEKTLTAFQGVESKNYYPQVYIPFYEELKSAGKIGTSEPMVVIGLEDKATLSGYRLNENGELVETGKIIDENYARQHEVWVLSINERVDNEGEVKPDLANGRTQGVMYPHARFQRFRVGLHKESWAGGASEVNIKRYLSFYTFDYFSPGEPHATNYSSEDSPFDGDGWRIYQFTRSDVDQNKYVTVNWMYISNWPTRQGNINEIYYHTDYLYYIVFEYDGWPTGMQVHTFEDAAGNPGIVTHFRSSDEPYTKSYIPEYAAEGWVVDLPYIGFNSQY